eukprot:1160418-Pelagomonas_calceolata.AAC.9
MAPHASRQHEHAPPSASGVEAGWTISWPAPLTVDACLWLQAVSLTQGLTCRCCSRVRANERDQFRRATL